MNDNGTAPAGADPDATAVIPAVLPGTLQCGDCLTQYAGDDYREGSPLKRDALLAAAVSAGWTEVPRENGSGWKCSVCTLRADRAAKAAAQPEPEVPVAQDPPPDTDPIDQSHAVLAAFDDRVPGFWSETNRANSAAANKISLRFGDGYHGFAAIFSRTPDLKADPEAAGSLRRYEAELAALQDRLHREALQRIAERRSDLARCETHAEAGQVAAA